MADENGIHIMRSIKLHLERQYTKDQIGRVANTCNSGLPPGPHLWTDILHCGNAGFLQGRLHGQIEVR